MHRVPNNHRHFMIAIAGFAVVLILTAVSALGQSEARHLDKQDAVAVILR